MTKIGFLLCGFECDEYIDRVLAPWLELKSQSNNSGDEFVFSCVYGQFKEYAEMFGQKTVKKPKWAKKYSGLINNFVLTETPDSEANHRNLALKYLQDQKCDIIWLLDIQDEIYTVDGIKNIINFIKMNNYYCWYSVSLKNYVFDEKTYLLDPFTPPRIFRTSFNGYKLVKFSFDNDPIYQNYNQDDLPGINYQFDSTRYTSYKQFSNTIIPTNIGGTIRHFTWLNNEKSKNKIKYHHQHFGPGVCSFKWNEQENKVEFNELYYRSLGQFVPFVGTD